MTEPLVLFAGFDPDYIPKPGETPPSRTVTVSVEELAELLYKLNPYFDLDGYVVSWGKISPYRRRPYLDHAKAIIAHLASKLEQAKGEGK